MRQNFQINLFLTATAFFFLIPNLVIANIFPAQWSNYESWSDLDNDCQNTFDEILIRRTSVGITYQTENGDKNKECVAIGGVWQDEYTNIIYENPKDLTLDFIVSPKHAFAHGGEQWSKVKIQQFINDPDNLAITTSSIIANKNGKTIKHWLPKNVDARCRYAKSWLNIKNEYSLIFDEAEETLVKSLIAQCPDQTRILMLNDHEPNLLGITRDSDDVVFMDFKISLEYPIFHDSLKKVGWPLLPSLAFTGRFGQYVGTRDSSPVIAKRFNPKLFISYKSPYDLSLSLGVGHESNGQKTRVKEQYDALVTIIQGQENTDESTAKKFARDYISRGWDYTYLYGKYSGFKKYRITLYGELRYYFPNGPLQGEQENYFTWEDWLTENDKINRSEIDTVSLAVKYTNRAIVNNNFFRGFKAYFRYQTGFRTRDEVFSFSIPDHHSIMAELTTNLLDVPITFTYAYGYNNDIAQYYKKNYRYSLSFEFRSFLADVFGN